MRLEVITSHYYERQYMVILIDSETDRTVNQTDWMTPTELGKWFATQMWLS